MRYGLWLSEVQNVNCFSFGKQDWQVRNYARWARQFADEFDILGPSADAERGLKSEKINNHNDQAIFAWWRLKCVDSKNYKKNGLHESVFKS